MGWCLACDKWGKDMAESEEQLEATGLGVRKWEFNPASAPGALCFRVRHLTFHCLSFLPGNGDNNLNLDDGRKSQIEKHKCGTFLVLQRVKASV